MSKLCLIQNKASHYRKAIYGLIDREFDCAWYFSESRNDIQTLPLDFFKEAHLIDIKGIKGPMYWQSGVLSIVSRKEYKTFLMTGELYALSTWTALLKAKLLHPKKKIYLWSHGWYGKESRKKALIKRLFFKMADGVFLYGNHAKNLMIKEGFNPQKLFVIHNSLDYDKQLAIRDELRPTNIYRDHFGNDHPKIIFIGRLTPVKHLDWLIDALKMMDENGTRCNLVFVGDGHERKKLEEYVEKLGLGNQVWFYGACFDDKINAELIYNADLCVSPGNVGLTAVHSLTFGTPVLTHNDFTWQMPEFEAIREGVTGDFFERNNVKSMCDVITRWLREHNSKEEREAVRQLCYNEIATSWNPEYQLDVLKKHIEFQ